MLLNSISAMTFHDVSTCHYFFCLPSNWGNNCLSANIIPENLNLKEFFICRMMVLPLHSFLMFLLGLQVLCLRLILSFLTSYELNLQAVIKQFSTTGYERSDSVVIDEVELQQHQRLEKLYSSTRSGRVRMVKLRMP